VAERISDIHQRDPNHRPDSDFEFGELAHLVSGNAGRMLDPRRTPMRVAALRPEIGSWVCEITAFEDQGARWTLPVESVVRFQFDRGATPATAEAVASLEEQIRRFATPLMIEPDRERAKATLAALGRRRIEAAAWLADREPMLRRTAELDHAQRHAPTVTVAAFETFMQERGLLEMDHTLAQIYVSNRHSGETVKGHLIVMAEMGITPFHGKIVRDPATFAGDWRRERRVDHVLWRTAFLHAMLAAIGIEVLELHRGVSSEAGITPSVGQVLESWSFSRQVAESVAGPPTANAQRVVHTRNISYHRAFMTYLETRAMNRQFLEAEAVLFAEGSAIEG
jgi:hypothetical protein